MRHVYEQKILKITKCWGLCLRSPTL